MKLKKSSKLIRKPIVEHNGSRQHYIDVSDSDIGGVEKLLLPQSCHFANDARVVIKTWKSVDVSACPGSGKTTVLLAKLKLLADRMPFDDNSGICVLSHTNVAVDEIKSRLSEYTGRLRGYPNYIGTIQGFIDRFITMPYLKQIYGRSIQPVDDRTYALHLLRVIYKSNGNAYPNLANFIGYSYKNRRGDAKDQADFVGKFYIRDDGALCVYGQKRALAGEDKPSNREFKKVLDEMIYAEGLIKYIDSYMYADDAIAALSTDYTDLFSKRFRYVFVDEYQDCKQFQRDAIEKVFDRKKSCVMYIGDPDQSIFSNVREKTEDWIPCKNSLAIANSNRFSQEIADILSPLKKDGCDISATKGSVGIKPTAIVFSDSSIERVIPTFISIMDGNGIMDRNGCYKAVGFVQKVDTSGISIGDYWSGYEETIGKNGSFKYWAFIENIREALEEGKLYQAETEVRKLLCKIFHYTDIRDADTGREFTVRSIKDTLWNEYEEIYTRYILKLSEEDVLSLDSLDKLVRDMINELVKDENGENRKVNLFEHIPLLFMGEIAADNVKNKDSAEKNIYIDPVRGRHIEFATVHSVKGQTHDATLYLETELSSGSDIGRILHCYGAGKARNNGLEEYSRKVAYVGMSRPRKLLCVAMQKKTFEKSGDAFKDWDVVEV